MEGGVITLIRCVRLLIQLQRGLGRFSPHVGSAGKEVTTVTTINGTNMPSTETSDVDVV